jgi:hypothetical protein
MEQVGAVTLASQLARAPTHIVDNVDIVDNVRGGANRCYLLHLFEIAQYIESGTGRAVHFGKRRHAYQRKDSR